MRGPGFLANARVACFISFAALFCSTNRAAAADAALRSARPAPGTDSPVKVVHLRKLARKILNWGHASEDEEPIRVGPIATRLFWHKKWKWPEPAAHQKVAGGLLGGPMLSIGLPIRALGRLFSIETRLCSFRYAYADLQSKRMLMEELADPHDEHQSLEGGLYLTLPLPRLF
jgi:hypothetical protein